MVHLVMECESGRFPEVDIVRIREYARKFNSEVTLLMDNVPKIYNFLTKLLIYASG